MAKRRKCQLDDGLNPLECVPLPKKRITRASKPVIDVDLDSGDDSVLKTGLISKPPTAKRKTAPSTSEASSDEHSPPPASHHSDPSSESDSKPPKKPAFDAVFRLLSSDIDSDYASVPDNHLSKRNRRKRLKQKPPQPPATCPYCDEILESKFARDQHIAKDHPVSHQCPVVGCSYRSGMRARMRQHEIRTHGKNAVQCPILGCEGRFVKRNLARHIREFHRNRVPEKSSVLKLSKEKLKCEHCDFSSRHQIKYENHVLDEHLTGVNCPVADCDTNVAGSKVEKHFEIDHPGVLYYYKPGDGIKLLSSTGDGDNVGTVSVSETDTDVEYVTIQNAQKVKFTCTHCQKTCTNRIALRRHIGRVHAKTYKNHAPKQQLPCTFQGCDRVFRCQALLNDHIYRHKGEFMYDCQSCKQKFVTRAQFGIHLRKFHNISIKDFEKANEETEKGKRIFNLDLLPRVENTDGL
uniref:C2H2-type domain-containing protein n=1 Tax=Panagrellus redivivus TaxID=6233 RepID=A0A7E4VFU7_PANRE